MEAAPFSKPDPKPLHGLQLDAYTMAQSAHEQAAALATLAGMSRPGQNLSGEEWMCLLTPLADHLGLLAKMLEHDALSAEWRLVRSRG